MKMKRIFDCLLILLVSPLVVPVYFLCIFVLIISQGSPIYFYQERVGLNGKIFRLIKFRSMVSNAEDLGGVQTLTNDARITHIGQLIRRTSLDELPQLLNVLRGDMSIVGPRPYLLKQREQFDEKEWTQRLLLPPGITGLAQISGRSELSMKERIKFDLEYIDKRTMIFDLVIILKTIKLVILQKGSN